MNDEDLVLIDSARSLQWNYVNRVERELNTNNQYPMVTMNPLLPKSYKEVVMTLAKSCNHSRVALLIDDNEEYVAFMLVVEEDYIPFLLEGMEDIIVPTKCIFKVFPNNELALSKTEEGMLHDFISTTVIPDLNSNIESWIPFRNIVEQSVED